MQPRRKKTIWLQAVGIVLVGFLWILVSRTMAPSIHVASLAEVRALVPPDLLVSDPSDRKAGDRFLKLASTAAELQTDEVLGLRNSVPNEMSLKMARQFWSNQKSAISEISQIIDSGKMEIPWRDADPHLSRAFGSVQHASQALLECARQFSSVADSETATKCMLLVIKISDGYANARGRHIDYRLASLLQTETWESIRTTVSAGHFTASQNRLLLKAITPATKNDPLLANAILNDFQGYTLPQLPHPNALIQALRVDGTTCGNYDALETTRVCAACMLEALHNTELPFSQMKMNAIHEAEDEARVLPVPPSPKDPSGFSAAWNTLNYRFAMNNLHNSVGRVIISRARTEEEGLLDSCRTRALRDVTRTVLAARAYMAEHRGSTPSSLSILTPAYLPTLPRDPFTGKGLIYLANKRMVYSVGENLADDGGAIGSRKDIGSAF